MRRHPRHTFAEWLEYRVNKFTGAIPWWWECDRTTCEWWNWSPEAETLLVQSKIEGMY